MKRFLIALLTLACLVSATAYAADINFVTAGTQSTFYPISVTIAELWNTSIEGMNATATPSGGGVDNLNQALDGEAQIGIANANLVYQSQEGIASFDGEPNPNIRIFAGLLKPDVLIGTMVDHQIHDNMQSAFFRLPQKLVHVVHRAEPGIDPVIV